MKNESIDNIFEGIDLNDEELLKEVEEVENFESVKFYRLLSN